MYRLGQHMQEPFLTLGGAEEEEQVIEVERGDSSEEEELVREVSSRYILHWNYRRISRLPRELLEHGGHVQQLYMKENLVEELPRELATSLPSLTHLYLPKNMLTSLPTNIGQLSLLTTLDISRNHLSSLPPSLASLTSLTTLDLSHNQLAVLPPCLTSLPSLHHLSLTSNRLSSLPSSLGNLLTTLQGLYLANNLLTSLPSYLPSCLTLKELYVDHNPLTHLPATLTSLPHLSILSLTDTLVSCLPALPSASPLRVQAEQCPRLASVPYLVGCQQSLLNMCQAAGWARPAQVEENTRQGVWNLRVWGGGGAPHPSPPHLLLPSGLHLPLPPGLQCSPASCSSAPHLKELCLRRLYPLLPGALSLALTTTPNLALHLVSLSPSSPKHLHQHLPSLHLPQHLTILLACPTSFCCSPSCRGPLFQEAALEVVMMRVQRGLAWSGEVEEMPIASLRLYCSSSCYSSYSSSTHAPWEEHLLQAGHTKFQVVME